MKILEIPLWYVLRTYTVAFEVRFVKDDEQGGLGGRKQRTSVANIFSQHFGHPPSARLLKLLSVPAACMYQTLSASYRTYLLKDN